MSFISTLPWWAWLFFALIPPAIIALYFLKLRRAPLVVPSTYLWMRTIEDLHVNSLWQRLQNNVLLYLQLLVVALLFLALLRPGCRSESQLGQRSILLIDHSASMSATDESPNRLTVAKQKALKLVDAMASTDVAMVISFSDRAEVRQGFTSDRRQLRTAIEGITETNRITDIREAVQAAAGLANPGRTSEIDNVNDIQVAEALPADLYVFSDGGFGGLEDFDLGNLSAKYIAIGQAEPTNIGIVALTATRNPEREEEIEVYGRLVNHSSSDKTVTTELYMDDVLIDATKTTLKPDQEAGVNFQLRGVEAGKLTLRVQEKDDLIVDNEAYTTITPTSKVEVLLVTDGNRALELALATPQAQKLARLTIVAPKYLDSPDFTKANNENKFDLIVFDNVSPKTMPFSNTLFLGASPAGDAWSFGEKQSPVMIVDTEKDHPLMRYLEMNAVQIFEGSALKSPEGATRLLESNIGTIIASAPRGPFLDVVCSFGLTRKENDSQVANTDWLVRRSFPIFLLNALEVLGNTDAESTARSILPGESIALKVGQRFNEVEVIDPKGNSAIATRGSMSQIVYPQTDNKGIYDVVAKDSDEALERFSVNLFSPRETQIKPLAEIGFGEEKVAAAPAQAPSRFEFWRWLTAIAVGLLTIEWIVYLRRIFV